MIETPRLTLRAWRDGDRAPYAAMSADPEVMDWLGGKIFTRAECDDVIDRLQAELKRDGHGALVIERRADSAFLGMVALARIPHGPPVPQGIEIAWRLARQAWGAGYAGEAAGALLADGLERLRFPQVFAFTAANNLRSQAVMRRLDMTPRPDLDFDHPALAEVHPLRRHVVYTATSPAKSATA